MRKSMTSMFTICTILLVFVLFRGVLAQDDETTAYEDIGGLFTLEYPSELVAIPGQFNDFLPVPNLALVVDEGLAQRSAEASLREDDWGMAVIFFPRPFFTQMGADEDATLTDLFVAATLGAVSPDDVEIVLLEDGNEAAQGGDEGITNSEDTEDNLLVLFEATNDVYVLVSLLTANGQRTDPLVAKWWTTVNSIEFNGTVDDVMTIMSDMTMPEFETMTYEDPDGLYALEYPAEMIVVPNWVGDFVPASIAIATSEDVVTQGMASEELPEDGWAMGILFLPQPFLEMMGIEITAETALEDVYLAWSEATWDPAWGAYETPEIESIVLDNAIEAVQSTSLSETEDVLITFFEISDGIYTLATILARPGERSHEILEQGMVVTNSITFTGTVEDLMAGMGGE